MPRPDPHSTQLLRGGEGRGGARLALQRGGGEGIHGAASALSLLVFPQRSVSEPGAKRVQSLTRTQGSASGQQPGANQSPEMGPQPVTMVGA